MCCCKKFEVKSLTKSNNKKSKWDNWPKWNKNQKKWRRFAHIDTVFASSWRKQEEWTSWSGILDLNEPEGWSFLLSNPKNSNIRTSLYRTLSNHFKFQVLILKYSFFLTCHYKARSWNSNLQNGRLKHKLFSNFKDDKTKLSLKFIFLLFKIVWMGDPQKIGVKPRKW